jgi:hypothetical protein
LTNADQISLPNRSRLYDIYERAKLDLHLTGLMQKRIDSILNKTLHYEIEGERVEEMEDFINSEKFQLFLYRLLENKFWGLTGFEFIPGAEFDFVDIPRKHIKPDLKVISIDQNGQNGFPYEEMPNLMVVQDKVEKFGLFLKLAFFTILKSGSISDLAQYIELFGQPIRVGTYPGDDQEAKANLKTALKESGGSFVVMMPEGTNIEIKGDHITNGDGKVHEAMHRICNTEMSVAVLGNTETTSNENGGSNAKSQEHGKQQLQITKSDIKWLGFIISSREFKEVLKTYGFPVSAEDKGKFVFEKEYDLDELKTKKDIWTTVSSQVPIAPDDWYSTFDIPKPKDFDKMWKQMEEERMLKLAPQIPPPNNGKKPGKKFKSLYDEWEHDFEPNDNDAPLVKKVKAAAKKYLQQLNDFFFPARS